MATLTNTERVILIRGRTSAYRDALRELGGVWDKEECAWRLPFAARFKAADLLRGSGCEIIDDAPAPEPQARPISRYMRLQLIHPPVVLNSSPQWAVVGDWFDVEPMADLFFFTCTVVCDGQRRPGAFFTCSERTLNRCFESQI